MNGNIAITLTSPGFISDLIMGGETSGIDSQYSMNGSNKWYQSKHLIPITKSVQTDFETLLKHLTLLNILTNRVLSGTTCSFLSLPHKHSLSVYGQASIFQLLTVCYFMCVSLYFSKVAFQTWSGQIHKTRQTASITGMPVPSPWDPYLFLLHIGQCALWSFGIAAQKTTSVHL